MTAATSLQLSGPEEFDLADQRTAMNALSTERVALGMELGDMEAKSGVSVNSFYAWRSVRRSPQLANLVAIAQTLGFEIVMIGKAPPHHVYSLHNIAMAMNAIDQARREKTLSHQGIAGHHFGGIELFLFVAQAPPRPHP